MARIARHVAVTLRAGMLAAALAAIASVAAAAEFRSTSEPATVLYDAPSTRARPLFVYGREVPVEVLVGVEGWTKVRDAAGTIGWMPAKSLSDRRVVVVRPPVADVRASAEDTASIVFRAEKDVILEVTETATSPSSSATPGWVRVRHRDGASGYIRLSHVFGF